MNTEFSNARIKKDKNFDGTFLFGVKTTGIFCRPSCPSPVAKEENVIYFNTIFEAIEKGFRPCYRCRPDVEVEYYNGNIHGASIVNTALGKIYDGYLNYNAIRDLAEELHLSDRHLRKLFIDHLGVPPIKIARYHKSLFAKKLLMFSDQSITDIAFASGFGSIRQFNDVFKEIFGKTPTMVREESMTQKSNPDNTTLLLKYKKPFNFGQILSFMALRAMEGMEVITENSFPRGLDHFFPTPSELIKLDLGGLGVTRTRQATIKTATQGILDRDVQLTANQSFDTFSKDFSKQKGIGEWTVNYVAMGGLGMLDSFPASDRGVIKALAKEGTPPSKKRIMEMAEKWRPYRSYATLCLWNRKVSA